MNKTGLIFAGYDYAVRAQRPDGVTETLQAHCRDQADALATVTGGQVVYRAVYVTGWEDAT